MKSLSHLAVRIAPALLLVAAAPPRTPSPIISLPLQPVVDAAKRSCAVKTASGLGYTALRPAAGARPAIDGVVLVNYIGYLAANGKTFDQSMAATFPIDGVIAGFAEGLMLMPKGSIYRLCIPARIGYGASAQGAIPANADLVFQVELLDFKTTAEIEAMRKAREQKAEAPPPAGEPKP